MSNLANKTRILRGGSKALRSMRVVHGAVYSAALISLMTPGARGATSYLWTNPGNGNWSNGANWAGGTAPVVDPAGDVNLEFNAPGGSYVANNDLGPFGVFNMTFDSGNSTTTLTGGQINLANPAAEPSIPFFTNDSTNPVTINNNVAFVSNAAQGAGTPEQFYLAPGSTTTFNGTVTVTPDNFGLKIFNNQSSGSGGPGGTMIWTQPTVFSNSPAGSNGNYFAFRVYEGTLEMGGYTIDNGTSNSVSGIRNIQGVDLFSTDGVNNGAMTDVYVGPEDSERNYPNDVASFLLTGPGAQMNVGVQFGDAATMTVGGVNTSGTVYYDDFFRTLPSDGNGTVNGVAQTLYYTAAAGGTVVQKFPLIGGGTGGCTLNVDKIGPGTWVVQAGGDNPTAVQAYQGNTTVRDGTLELAYDDTGTGNVTMPAAVLTDPAANYYASGADGGSLGFNAATNAVQLGDGGTLPTDNIALLTLLSSSGPTRLVVHNINVNNFNPAGTTTIGVGDGGIGNFQGSVLLNRSTILTSGTGGQANFSGNITGVGGITASGTGTVDLSGANGYGGSTTVSSGAALVIGVAGALPLGSTVINNGGLTINGNTTTGNISGTGTLTIAASSSSVVKLATGSGASSQGALVIDSGGALDINNDHMFLTDSPSTATAILGYLKTGSVAHWGGSAGIISSAAFVNTNYGVGFGEGSAIPSIPTGKIRIGYALYGDVNQDGSVNGTDFAILAASFGKSVTGGWEQGDLDYSGAVTGADFALLAQNFGKSASGASISLPEAQWAALDSFAAAHGLLADVPEPGSIALSALAGISLLGRRRRKAANV